jgi:hypothetical protein
VKSLAGLGGVVVQMLTVITLAATLVGCGASGEVSDLTRVPALDTTSLGVALTRLQSAGLRVSLTDFGPLPPGYALEDAPVGDQEPEAGERVQRGSVVHLNMHGVAPQSTPGFLTHHPRFAVIPNLVGRIWPRASSLVSKGYSVQIGHVPSLPARDPRDALGAYVVLRQSLVAGTRVVFAGTKTETGYANPILLLVIGVMKKQ